jgi:hypothetical protein
MPGIRIVDAMPPISIEAERVFELLGFPISNSLIASWLTMLILIVVSLRVSRNMKQLPEHRRGGARDVLQWCGQNQSR